MQMYDKHDMMIIMPMRICMKCFLKHAYVLEVECYVYMSMKCKEYVLWTMMLWYAYKNACQEWYYACLTEMRKYEMSMN